MTRRPDFEHGGARPLSLDEAIALIPVLLDEVRAVRRENGELRALIDPQPWRTRAEAAAKLRVHVDTIDAMIQTGASNTAARAGACWSRSRDGPDRRGGVREGRPSR